MEKAVLLVAYSIDPLGGSEPKTAWNFIKGIIDLDYEVHLITTPGSTERIRNSSQISENQKIEFTSVRTYDFGKLVPKPFGGYMRYLVWQMKCSRIIKRLDSTNYLCGHHVNWGNLLLGTPLRHFRRPYVFGPAAGGTKENVYSERSLIKSLQVSLREYTLKLFSNMTFVRNSILNAQIVLVANKDSLEFVKKIRDEGIILMLPDAIEESWILNDVHLRQSQKIVWTGRFIKRKNPEQAILAFAQLSHKFPDSNLHMFGNGKLRNRCRELVSTLNLNDRVFFEDRIPWDDMMERFSDFKFHLFSSSRDSFGSQILEASSRGVPSIIYEGMPALEWISPDAAFIAPKKVNSPPWISLSETLELALNSSDNEWKIKSIHNLSFARLHTLEGNCAKIDQYYRKFKDKS